MSFKTEDPAKSAVHTHRKTWNIDGFNYHMTKELYTEEDMKKCSISYCGKMIGPF